MRIRATSTGRGNAGANLPRRSHACDGSAPRLVAERGRFSRGMPGRYCALDAEVRQPAEPAGQVPVAVAEEGHAGRNEDGADDGGVEEDRDGQAEAELLEEDELTAGKGGEDDDHDRGGTGDDPRRRSQSGRDGLAVVARP